MKTLISISICRFDWRECNFSTTFFRVFFLWKNIKEKTWWKHSVGHYDNVISCRVKKVKKRMFVKYLQHREWNWIEIKVKSICIVVRFIYSFHCVRWFIFYFFQIKLTQNSNDENSTTRSEQNIEHVHLTELNDWGKKRQKTQQQKLFCVKRAHMKRYFARHLVITTSREKKNKETSINTTRTMRKKYEKGKEINETENIARNGKGSGTEWMENGFLPMEKQRKIMSIDRQKITKKVQKENWK